MMPAGINNNEELKRREQYLRLRGAQMAMEESGQIQTLGTTKARGSRKQLVGTIIGVAAAALILFLLALYRVI